MVFLLHFFSVSSPVAGENFLKSPSEIEVEYGVDDGVQGRINVSQPCYQILEPSLFLIFLYRCLIVEPYDA